MAGNKKEKIKLIFEKWAELVDVKIKEILVVSVDKNNQKLIAYQAETGGKKFRPGLVIASCLACGGKTNNALYPATGLEILHNCTLIYDDIIDKSVLRRGRPTLWAEFGKSAAQCAGLDYAAAIFQAANKSKYPIQISEIFAQTMKKIVDGEIMDILFEQSGREDEKYIIENRFRNITEKDYLKMIGKKTASLIQSCCEVGAISAGAKKNKIEALKKYGFNLGVVFQIKDDILDVFGEEKEFGKKIGKDIQERKLGNIVISYALKELSGKEKKRFLSILKKQDILDQDIKEALRLINKTKAEEKSIFLGEKYLEKTKENLKHIPQSKWKNLLAEIADFTMKRMK